MSASKQLFLVRHGEAVMSELLPGRPLSNLGVEETGQIAKELKKRQVSPEKIWYSTRLRAEQTAKILAEEMALPGVVVEKKDGIGPNDAVEAFSNQLDLEFASGTQKLLVVGHLPFLPDLLRILVKAHKTLVGILFTESSVLCLESEDGHSWKVAWFISPSSLHEEKTGDQ